MAAPEFAKLRFNVPKLYAFAFFQMFLVVLPVIVPFFQSKGLSLSQIFSLQAIYGAALIALDAPSGYFADVFGRKLTLVIGSVITAAGFQILWFGRTFTHFAIYEVIIGLGLSLQSGCDVAILYNTLDCIKMEGGKAGFLGMRLTYATAGEGFASLLGGFLAGVSLDWPAYANAIVAVIPVLVALTIVEPVGQCLPRHSHLQNLRAILRALFGHSKMLTFTMVNYIFYGFGTFCAVWSLQPYWHSRGIAVASFGYLWAINNFLVAFVARYASVGERLFGSVSVVVAVTVLPIVGYFGMGLTPGLFGLIFVLAFPLCRALNQVLLQDAINTRVPAEMRATANSVGSLGMRGLFIVFGPMIGHLLDTRGPDATMNGLGFVYLIGFFFVGGPLLTQRRHFRMS